MKIIVGMDRRKRKLRKETVELGNFKVLCRMCCIRYKKTKLLEIKKKLGGGEDAGGNILKEVSVNRAVTCT